MQQELTPQQHQAIELLATGVKIGCIAQTLDISRETLWRWRQLPAFEEAQRERMRFRRDQMKEHIAEIVRLSLVAIELELELAAKSPFRNPLDPALTILRMLDPARTLNDPEPAAIKNSPPSGH